LRRARERLREAGRRHGVDRIRVFGSIARGEDRIDSDVDLLVDLDPDRTLLDLIGFRQDAERILGARVDVAAPRFMKPRVRSRALRDARPV
jgi:predicted nucleotidyltransferase